jgi:hypothetical protein
MMHQIESLESEVSSLRRKFSEWGFSIGVQLKAVSSALNSSVANVQLVLSQQSEHQIKFAEPVRESQQRFSSSISALTLVHTHVP